MSLIEAPTLIDALPGGIEAGERRGQARLAASSLLPAKVTDADRALLESWGVRFEGEAEGDPLFVRASLPEGWDRRSTEHAYYTRLVDAQGLARAEMFYKAAFYDRRADMRVLPRYRVSAYGTPDDAPLVGRVFDADGTVLFETRPVTIATGLIGTARHNALYETRKRLEEEACAWLDEHRPGWQDKATSWQGAF